MKLIVNDNIQLRNIIDEEKDYKLLHKWCTNKNVYKYFEQRILSYEEIIKKYKGRTKEDCNVKTFMIIYKKLPVGLIQYYDMELSDKQYFELDKFIKVAAIDIFIGDPNYQNLGIGRIVMTYLSNYLLESYNLVVVIPETENVNAIKCYENGGFIKTKEYEYSNTIGDKTHNILMKKTSK